MQVPKNNCYFSIFNNLTLIIPIREEKSYLLDLIYALTDSRDKIDY